MALVSAITPLASRSCPHKSLAKSAHELKALPRTVPTLRLFDTRGKSIAPSIIMCLTPAVERRVANHHANLWGDDFIQSLSTPYGAPSYLERAQRIIGEVKEIIKSISVDDGILISPLNDLLQRLSIVDSVERLGIHRHFKNEIKLMLDYVYSYWNEKGIGCGRDSAVTDLNSTALGLRILRLHGYLVSSDVLEYFKDQKGQFVCSSKFETGDIRSVLNLFRASLVAFPSEKIMEEAEIFSTTYLKEALQKVPVSSLSRQIEYFIEYGWHTNLLRLETRNFIDLFGKDNIEMPYMIVEKLLELAKLEFNIFHSLQQEELKHISRWWKDSGFPELTFARHRHVEYYTLASCFATDPNQSAFRLGFAKNCHLITVLDDIYDTFGTMEELKLFTAAVKRWDPSATELLPEYMKGLYVVLCQTVNEMAREADKSQGRDTIHYARQAWEAYIDSYMKEAEWISSGFLPTFGEYYENGKVTFGYSISKLQPMLTLDVHLPHNILQEIDFPSRLNDLAAGILRLKGDTRCYKADRENGEEASCISCYMKDNPESTEEDALNHINTMVKNLIKELNWELLRPDKNVPISLKKLAVDIAKDRDAYSLPKNEIKNLVMITVLESEPDVRSKEFGHNNRMLFLAQLSE